MGVLGISRNPAVEMGHATKFLNLKVVMLEISKTRAMVKMHVPMHSPMVYYLREPSTGAAIRIEDVWNCKLLRQQIARIKVISPQPPPQLLPAKNP